MTHYILYCKNCGAKYTFQGSGRYIGVTPREYNDRDYCPECKKAIIDSLEKIEKKSFLDWVSTNEVTLENLLNEKARLREEEIKKVKEDNLPNFPKLERVYASEYNLEKGEHTIQNEVILNKKKYFYRYFASKKDEAKISKRVRKDSKTQEVIEDNFYHLCEL